MSARVPGPHDDGPSPSARCAPGGRRERSPARLAVVRVWACLLMASVSALAMAQTGDTDPAATCGLTSHSGASGVPFAFGRNGVNATAVLENVAFEAGSTGSGAIIRFRDSTGRTYTAPAGSGRWLLTNSTTTTRVTVTFSPAIPAHRIGVGIYDMGVWSAAQPNNGEDPTYMPKFTLSLAGGAMPADFVGHPAGTAGTPASYTPTTGVVTLDATAFVPGVEQTWRQSIFLRGNANALVSQLTLTATDIRQGDNIGFGLTAIPSCVAISKVTSGGVGSFSFTPGNLTNWNNTAIATPVTLTTTAAGTAVRSTRFHYAHPISSANAGTQPVTLAESIPSGWILSSAQCTDANSARNGNTGSFGSLSGGVLTIPADRMRFESDITCTFTNTRAATDVRVQKSVSPTPVPAGSVLTYTLVVTNAGPVGAPGAVLTDAPGPGLDCTTPSAVFSCSATGGAACPAGNVPVTTLLGAGMNIPSLPPGGEVTATLACTVTASGFP